MPKINEMAKKTLYILMVSSAILAFMNVWFKPRFLVFLISGSLFGVAAYCSVFFASRIKYLEDYKRELDEKLLQSQKMASIGEISAGIAHEINNPLAIITQEIQWINHCMKEKPQNYMDEIVDSLKEIDRQVKRCREITHKLIGLARERKPVFQFVDINEVVNDMVNLVECTVSRGESSKQIIIERDYDDKISLILTDAPLLRQVVLNLLNNAVQSLPDKGGLIKVSTRVYNNNMVEIVVSDTGCGIPSEHLDKIFLPFFTTKPPGLGTGLGLFISYTIVDKLGGNIEVESSLGKGSTFRVKLPVDREVPIYGGGSKKT